jgi:hypothetical protein
MLCLLAKYFRGIIVAEKNGRVLVQNSYGAAVEEWQIPNSPETRFEIASVSKQFTAAAILQLADNSKLSRKTSSTGKVPDVFPNADVRSSSSGGMLD